MVDTGHEQLRAVTDVVTGYSNSQSRAERARLAGGG